MASVAAAPRTSHERVAVIDLGPDPADATARRAIAAALVAARLEPVLGDGVEDALAGQAQDPDALQLASALARAEHAFGALDCAETTSASAEAAGIAAARQAAGLPVPELARAWTYTLLCADRANDVDGAMTAAARLRAIGGGADVPAAVWAKYPDVDVLSNRDLFDVEIRADVDGAAIWIDHVRAGVSPLKLPLAAGAHVIAAAMPDGRRGWAAGTAVRKQPQIAVVTHAQTGTYSALATRIASWHGTVPAPAEIGAALTAVHARLAIIRHGAAIEAWGRLGLADTPHLIGGDEAVQKLADAPQLAELVADRARGWDAHAPDPDVPLLTETPQERLRDGKDPRDVPTKWWVYATIFGVIGAGVALVYAHDQESNTQRVELHYP